MRNAPDYVLALGYREAVSNIRVRRIKSLKHRVKMRTYDLAGQRDGDIAAHFVLDLAQQRGQLHDGSKDCAGLAIEHLAEGRHAEVGGGAIYQPLSHLRL